MSVVFVKDVESAKEISPVLRSRSRPCFNGAGTKFVHILYFVSLIVHYVQSVMMRLCGGERERNGCHVIRGSTLFFSPTMTATQKIVKNYDIS